MDGQCNKCRSWAINHHSHGRDGSDGDLCDVCYWRKRAESVTQDALRYRWLRDVGDATWRPFALRGGYSAAKADEAIDAAMKTPNS